MPSIHVLTDLRCAACVAAIAADFDREPGIIRWSADVGGAAKTLMMEGPTVDRPLIERLLARHGYRVLGEASAPAANTSSDPMSIGPLVGRGGSPGRALTAGDRAPAAEAARAADVASGFLETYRPLLLIVGYLLGAVAISEWAAGSLDVMRAMNRFMAGFFLVFSFFKLLDVGSFTASFRMYDPLAARIPGWGHAYPFVELSLGALYLAGVLPLLTNLVTLVLMSVGAAGVLHSVLNRRAIRCACLGTVFRLPMSTVTLIEDGSMALMAAGMLLHHVSG
jgi:hypothetical protein